MNAHIQLHTITKLNAVCFYARKDQAVKKASERFFETFLNYYMQDIKYQEIDLLTNDQLEKLCKDVELVVILYSANLRKFNIWKAFPIKRIISKHHLKLLSAACVLVDNFEPVDNPLAKLPKLPSNHKPILSQYWNAPENAFEVIFRELMPLCQIQIARKLEVYDAWQGTLRGNDLESYESFYENYPHSPFAVEAQKKYQELSEKQLWQETIKTNTIHAYVDYLMDDSMEVKAHQFAAAKKIFELEEDVDRRWAEVQQQGLTKLRYQFMNFYAEWAGKRKAAQGIVPILGTNNNATLDARVKKYAFDAYATVNNQPFLYKKEKFDKEHLETNYLDYLAAKQRKSHEIFDYQIYVKNFKQQVANLGRIVKDTRGKQGNLIVMGLLLLAFYLIMWRILGTAAILLLLPTLVVLFYLANCHGNVGTDIKNLQKGIASLNCLGVLLRVAMVRHDNNTVTSIINFSRFVEKKAAEIHQKSMLNYFYHSATTLLGKEMEVPEEFTDALEAGQSDKSEG